MKFRGEVRTPKTPPSYGLAGKRNKGYITKTREYADSSLQD